MRKSKFDIGNQPTPTQFLREREKTLLQRRMAHPRVSPYGLAYPRLSHPPQPKQEDSPVGRHSLPSLRAMAISEFTGPIRLIARALAKASRVLKREGSKAQKDV